MSWDSTVSVDDLAARLESATSVICVTHAKPDGDAIGSVLAIVRGLSVHGQAEGWLVGPVPEPLTRLVGDTAIRVFELGDTVPDDTPDLIVVVDTGAWTQVSMLGPWLRANHDRVVVIDHHASGNEEMSDTRLIDASAASATLIVLRVLQAMGVDLGRGNDSVAEALFAGLATDTGWFRQANADAAAFSAAAELLAHDVDKNRLHRMIEETARPQRLALLARLLDSIEWIADGRGAIMKLKADDFTATGGRRDELTGLVNEPLVVDGVEFSALLTEDPPDGVKMSLRSKPPKRTGGPFVNVRDVASHLGGGGHVHASGGRVTGDLGQARQALLEALVKAGVMGS